MKFAIFTNVPGSIGRLKVRVEALGRGHTLDLIDIRTMAIDKENIESLAKHFYDHDVVHHAGGLGVLASGVQKILEEKGVFCINSASRAVPNWGNKVSQAWVFSQNGIPTPKTLQSDRPDFDELSGSLGLPFVAKDPRGSQGKGVWLIHSASDLEGMTSGKEYLFQEYIENDGDFRVHVLGGAKAFCPYKRVSTTGDFRSNVSLGGSVKSITDQQVLDDVSKIAIDTARAMGLDYCGVDIVRSKKDGNYFVLETNSDPGFKYVEEVTGESFAVPIVDYYERVSLR